MVQAQDQPEDYAVRFGQLSRAYAQNPNAVDALYDMAQFYFDNSHPLRNLPAAMEYIQRAEEEHIRLLENNKIKELTRLGRKGIDLVTLRQTKQAIVAAARNIVALRNDMTIAEIDAYMAAFSDDADLVRQLRQRRLRRLYDEALAKDTPLAYYQFAVTYPGTGEAAQMEDRLLASTPALFAGLTTEQAIDSVQALYRLSPSIVQEANRRKSRLAFQQAESEGTLEAYNRYLDRYPTSSESQLARDRIDASLDADLDRLHNALDLARFAEAHADLPLADEALARMRELIYDNHDAVAAQYYVDHFPLDPYRNEVYARYFSWYTVEGSGAPLHTFAEANPNFVYPNALDNELERAEAIDTIPLNVRFSEADYTAFADYTRQLMGKAIALVPLQRMIQPLMAARNYRAALERVQRFAICFENQWQGQYDEFTKLIVAPTAAIRLRRELADSLDLRHPVVNAADGRLYYTRLTPHGNSIAYAVLQGNTWQPAGTVTFDGTMPADLTLFNFYADGNRMLLGTGGDIWIAERDGDTWRVSDLPPYPVNTDYVETDAYMLPDGSGMLLASDRPGGRNLQPSRANFHGDTALASDLWYIPYSNQHWGTPVNLPVNTPYAERSPLLSRNLRTLYFISDGYTGLGYGDVYVAERRTTDDWSSWSTPRNAGREVNSPFRELDLSFSPDESRLYLASDRQLPPALYSVPSWHERAVSYASFRINVDGLEPYLFRVRAVDLDKQEVAYTSDYLGEGSILSVNVQREGRYLLLADAGNRFVPAVPVDNDLSGVTRLQGFTYRQLVASDRAMVLHAILFDSTETLLPVARMQLEQLALFLQQQPDARIEFSINVAGSDTRACYTRSLARGETLRTFLAEHGVPASHVILSPYGNVNVGLSGHSSVSIRFRE